MNHLHGTILIRVGQCERVQVNSVKSRSSVIPQCCTVQKEIYKGRGIHFVMNIILALAN